MLNWVNVMLLTIIGNDRHNLKFGDEKQHCGVEKILAMKTIFLGSFFFLVLLLTHMRNTLTVLMLKNTQCKSNALKY